MKVKLLSLFLLFSILTGFSQNTDYYDRMEYVFGNIDKNKVTTGYLKEFGIRFNEVETYNGVISSDNLVDENQWQSLYSSLYTMRVGNVAASMTAPNTVFDNLKAQQDSATEDVLFAAQHYNYQQYKTNAVNNGDVTVVKDRIYDTKGRNPYDTKTIFGVAPLNKQLKGDVFTFKLPNGLIYTNTNLTLNQVEIDFDDGNGYQIVALNTINTISYNSGGEKNIKVKFIYTNGPTLYSQSKIWVDYIASSGGSQARFDGIGRSFETRVGEAYQGDSATGFLTIETAGTDGVFDKPLIVVEGFDPENRFDYTDLVININNLGPGGLNIDIDPTGDITTLNQAIEDEEYDLVFVNFANSTDFIQRNAYMVETVIDWVNTEKALNGSTEKNVVLGMSMGGLVARYALRDMEINGDTHDTKLYISHDAPHQGANVPLAYQAMVRHLVGEQISLPVFLSLFDVDIVDIADQAPDLLDGLALLQTPAAQQMITYQLQGTGNNVSIENTTLQSAFLTEYSNMGYPQQNGIRNIAIANGSECGTPLDFANSANLVDVDVTIDLPFFITNIALTIVNGLSVNPLKVFSSFFSTNTDVKARFNLRALDDKQAKQIYLGKLFIKKTVLFLIDVEEPLIDQKLLFSSASMLPLDNANGGIYDIETFADLPQELDNFVLEREFSFIPTYSSLDIGSGNETIITADLAKIYNPFSPPVAPKDIPFDNFFANPNTSEQHIQFTLNNGNWLVAELADTPEINSCTFECLDGESIIGPGLICSSSTYTLGNSSTTTTWSLIPANAGTITENSNTQITVHRAFGFSGSVVLRADITAPRCDTATITRDIHFGRPTASGSVLTRNGGGSLNPGPADSIAFSISTQNINAWNSISWVIFSYSNPNASQYFSVQTLNNGTTTIVQADQNTPSGNYVAQARVTNNCGFLPFDINFTVEDSGPPVISRQSANYAVYPNPSKDIVNIALITNDKETGEKETKVSGELFDVLGKSKIKVDMQHNGAQFNVARLNPGVYVLKIYLGETIETHQVLVN